MHARAKGNNISPVQLPADEKQWTTRDAENKKVNIGSRVGIFIYCLGEAWSDHLSDRADWFWIEKNDKWLGNCQQPMRRNSSSF
jgi:hypothetical protein